MPLPSTSVVEHQRRPGRRVRGNVGDPLRRLEPLGRDKGPHTLRHTFCSHLAMRGAPASAIQKLAGHSALVTTERYMHLSPAALESAIRLLEAPAPTYVGAGRSREAGIAVVGDMLETGSRV